MKKWNRRLVYITLKQSSGASGFVQYLHGLHVNIYKLTVKEKTIQFAIERRHLPHVRKGRRRFNIKLTIKYANSSRIIQKDAVTFLGIAMLILVPLILMQYVWRIDVKAPTIELEDNVQQFIQKELALQAPMSKGNLPSDYLLRQEIMQKYREFSWVHITKQGSHIIISPQLAPVNKIKEPPKKPHHLIASNSGVITHFQLQSGERKVFQNMTVYKGDTLVSGIIETGEQNYVVGAVGEVYADYWLESTFSIPRTIEYQTLLEKGWNVKWNWKGVTQALEKQSLKPLATIVDKVPYQKFESVTEVLEEEHIESFVLPLLHEKMLQSLPLKSVIKKENLLHVTIDDDTVKGKVLFLVNENIATPYPIYQGE